MHYLFFSFFSDKQLWLGLINPTKIDCLRETCDGQLVWDNDAQDPFVWAEFYRDSVVANEGDKDFVCLRINPAFENLNDGDCEAKAYFVCQN